MNCAPILRVDHKSGECDVEYTVPAGGAVWVALAGATRGYERGHSWR